MATMPQPNIVKNKTKQTISLRAAMEGSSPTDDMVGRFLLGCCPVVPAPGYFYTLFCCCASARRAGVAHFNTASVLFLWHCAANQPASLPFFHSLIRFTAQATHGPAFIHFCDAMQTVCTKPAHPRLGASTHSPFHFSDLPLNPHTPPPLLSRLPLDARSSGENSPTVSEVSAS